MINEELVFVDQALSNQKDVFNFLAQVITNEGLATDEAQVHAALEKRESEGTTGMMDGFAIPHAKSSAIAKPAIVVMKLKAGIEWGSLDGKQTQYIITLFIPENESGDTHLKILSQVARMLLKEEFKEQFIQTNSSSELTNLISRQLEGEK